MLNRIIKGLVIIYLIGGLFLVYKTVPIYLNLLRPIQTIGYIFK